MNFLEQRAFHGTMSMGHALGADHDMICGHEVIGLAGPDERMILFAETQIFLLIKPLRLDAGYKARIGAHGDIDVPGLERAHHLIAAERKGSVASVRRLERSEEHTSELQSLMRTSYAVFCLKKKKTRA